MSSGIVHAKATAAATPVVAAVVFFVSKSPELAAISAVGCLSGILLSPDLDQETISHFEWKLIRATFGIGFLWLAFWGPYATLIPHRSFLSHFPVVSTVFRILYLWGGMIFLNFIGIFPRVPDLLGLVKTPEFLVAVAGLIVSDSLHWLFDQL